MDTYRECNIFFKEIESVTLFTLKALKIINHEKKFDSIKMFGSACPLALTSISYVFCCSFHIFLDCTLNLLDKFFGLSKKINIKVFITNCKSYAWICHAKPTLGGREGNRREIP